MEEKKSWADVEPLNIKTPQILLEEQARIFNERFPDGRMRCLIEKAFRESGMNPFDREDWFNSEKEAFKAEKNLVVKMLISVPLLDSYTVQLLKVSYKISQLYPCELINSIKGTTENCQSEEAFVASLELLLRDESVSKVIATLLAQI